MKVEKLRDGLAVALPEDVVEALGLKPGDEIDMSVFGRSPATQAQFRRRPTAEEREAAIARMREMARPLPEGYKFDREEANQRGPE